MSSVRNDYDLDGIELLIAECAKLAIADYLAGPYGSTTAADHFQTSRTYLINVGLLDRVHGVYGHPAARYATMDALPVFAPRGALEAA